MPLSSSALLPARELEEHRRLFPVTRRRAYLDHAAIGPLPAPAAAAAQRALEQQRDLGAGAEESWAAGLSRARQAAARLLGAAEAEVALVRSTTGGLLIVANSLAWREGDVILSVEGEFPANVSPWQALERRGVRLRLLSTPDGRVPLEEVRRALDGRVRLLAISFVEFFSGLRNDLVALGELCAEREVLFCVDAIQGLGALPLDVREAQVDFLAAGGYKWLLSPLGSGLFYCRRERLAQMGPAMLGWLSREGAEEELFRYDLPLRPDARRFEESAPGLAPLLGMGESLELLLRVGVERIAGHVLALGDRLIGGVAARGYRLLTPLDGLGHRSGIVTFRHPELPAAELHQRLTAKGLALSLRGEALRASPHFYNSPEEIDLLLESLP